MNHFRIEGNTVFLGWISFPITHLKEFINALTEWKKLKFLPKTWIGSKENGILVYSYDPLKDKENELVFVENNPKYDSFIVIEKPSLNLKDLPNKIIFNLADTIEWIKELTKMQAFFPQY